MYNEKRELLIDNQLINLINKLNINKQSLLISNLSYLQFSGIFINCKMIKNNLFELNYNNIFNNKSIKLYYYINNTNVLISNNLTQFDNINIQNYTNIINYINDNILKDIQSAKVYYKYINELSKNNNNNDFLYNQLDLMYKKYTKDDFKLITKSKINTILDLQNKLNCLIKLKSIEKISEEINVSISTIKQILKIKDNININELKHLLDM